MDFRTFAPADQAAVLQVLCERAPGSLAARAALFDWQFGANPHSDGRSPFIVGEVDGKIGAVNGVMPVRIRYQGKPLQAVWSCDTAVLIEHRGKGYGKEVVRRIAEEATIVLGYGISDMAAPLFSRQGWDSNQSIRGFFFYDHEAGARGVLKNASSRLLRFAKSRGATDSFQITREGAAAFGAEVDELWERCAPGYVNVVERDAAYLRWKYQNHPRLTYTVHAARRDGKLEGLLITRHDATESTIVDYAGPTGNPELKSALLTSAVEHLCQEGTVRIRCETTDDALIEGLERGGFRAHKGEYRFRVWSNVPGDEGAAQSWFLMTGDSDNDFLHGC